MKRVIWSIVGAAALLSLIAVAAVKKENLPSQTGAAVGELNGRVSNPIRIGGLFGLTGVCAEFGEGELRGATLAIEEVNNSGGINGRELDFIAEDTMCENKSVANATQKLLSVNQVEAIIGPTWGDTFQSGYPIAQKKGILSLGASSALESLAYTGASRELIFSTWFPQNLEIDALERYISAKGHKKVSIIHDQDPFGAMMGMLFKDQATRHGLEIVEEVEVPTGTDDFRTYIARMKLKKPDAVFASFVSPDHKAVFFKQAQELNFAVAFFASADTENPALLDSFATVLEGVIFTSPKGSRGYDEFARRYEERWKEKPRVSSSHAYDAVKALAAAIEKAGTTRGVELQEVLLAIEIPGVTYDTLKFSSRHQITGGEFVVKTVREGKFITIED